MYYVIVIKVMFYLWTSFTVRSQCFIVWKKICEALHLVFHLSPFLALYILFLAPPLALFLFLLTPTRLFILAPSCSFFFVPPLPCYFCIAPSPLHPLLLPPPPPPPHCFLSLAPPPWFFLLFSPPPASLHSLFLPPSMLLTPLLYSLSSSLAGPLLSPFFLILPLPFLLLLVASLPHKVYTKDWLFLLTGVMVFISSVLYFVKTIKWRQDRREEELRAKNQTYDRWEINRVKGEQSLLPYWLGPDNQYVGVYSLYN